MGSAPNEDSYLIIEQAKPWPAKVKKMDGLLEELQSGIKKHKDHGVKILATPELPWESELPGPRAVLVRGQSQRALCHEFTASAQNLQNALNSEPQGEPKKLFLVCTHGSRDPCCGLVGVPVYRALKASGQRDVLQVSHLGGHRFAPVILAFPEWRFYGHLNSESCLEMDKDLATEQAHLNGYRGHGRLPSHLQSAEAELWRLHGNKLLEVQQLEGDKTGGVIQAKLSDGSELRYQAQFELTKREGFKSCKDFKKNKQSMLKVHKLSKLEPLSSLTV